MRRYKSVKDLKMIGNSKMHNQNARRSAGMLNACINVGNPFDEVG